MPEEPAPALEPANNPDKALFTVVIPAYNSRLYIKQCLQSLVAQSLNAWNCIVVDDGSTDETAEIVGNFCLRDPRVRLIRQNCNAGPSEARNVGIRQADTDWVTFLDSDDQYLPSALQTFRRTADFFQGLEHFGVMSAHYCGSLKQRSRDSRIRLVDVFGKNLLPNDGPGLLPSALAVARRCFEEVGYFRTMECEDLEFWLRLTTTYRVAHISETTTIYRQDQPDSRNERLKKNGKIARAHLTILEDYAQEAVLKERLADEPDLYVNFHQHYTAALETLRAADRLYQGDSVAAAAHYLRARDILPNSENQIIFYLKDLFFFPQSNVAEAALRFASYLKELARAVRRVNAKTANRLTRSAADNCFLQAASSPHQKPRQFWGLLLYGLHIDLTTISLKSALRLSLLRCKESKPPLSSLKVGIYNEPGGPGLGGCELTSALLAERLAEDHEVDFIHRKPGLTREELGRATGTNLEAVQLRYVELQEFRNSDYRFPFQSMRRAQSWGAEISQPYDLFIPFVHGFPPFCHARKGAFVLLFPFPTPLYKSLLPSGSGPIAGVKNWLAKLYYQWEWRTRLAGYPVKLANSSFTAEWAQRRWDATCQVVNPPSSLIFDDYPKSQTILSVGRFAVDGHSKKQDAMLAAFQRLSAKLEGWEYTCVGALSASPREQLFFQDLQSRAEGLPVRLMPNLERPDLVNEYQRASIFWHAAGFDSDEQLQPEMAEHFGIVTVEAMAAGCVPVVANRGGQKDIVEHGKTGFLWSDLGELESYTLELARNEHLRQTMALAAKARASQFTRERHLEQMLQALKPLLNSHR